MVFAHDTEQALASAVALVNSIDPAEATDSLTTVGELDAFIEQWRWTGARTRTRAELESVRELRAVLRQVWESDEDEAVVVVNGLLRDAGALPQLVRHDGWGYHLHATSSEAPLAERMSVEAAMAFVDVIRSEALDRLRVCAAPDCAHVLVDLSKNQSRRFCDAGCGNRVSVAAYRARQRAQAG